MFFLRAHWLARIALFILVESTSIFFSTLLYGQFVESIVNPLSTLIRRKHNVIYTLPLYWINFLFKTTTDKVIPNWEPPFRESPTSFSCGKGGG